MSVKLEASWKQALESEFAKDYFQTLTKTIRQKYLSTTVYPPPKLVFNAFNRCHFDQVRVVILGQDPYHGPGQAMGLAFSVPTAVATPPSLKNICKEIEADTGAVIPKNGNLERWASQGVFLLNATLTVAKGQAASHQGLGWEQFTDAVIKVIAGDKEKVVFLLWGAYARSKAGLIDSDKHLVLEAPHPSPLSANRGFLGCRHFSRTNDYFNQHGQEPIVW